VRRHTVRGGDILSSFKSLENVGKGALYHHELYNEKIFRVHWARKIFSSTGALQRNGQVAAVLGRLICGAVFEIPVGHLENVDGAA